MSYDKEIWGKRYLSKSRKAYNASRRKCFYCGKRRHLMDDKTCITCWNLILDNRLKIR